MGRILEQAKQFFERENWQYSEIENENALQTAFTSDQGTWLCFVQAIEDEVNQRFLFYSVCPLKAQEHLQSVAEFITRANYGLPIGNFELDFADGEIRFKTSMDVMDNSFGVDNIESLVYTNALIMDRYLPGLLSVLSNDTSPEKAIEVIEMIPEIGSEKLFESSPCNF